MDLNRVNILDAALTYRERGWSVIPTGGDKKPAIRRWKPFQTTPADEDQLRTWFATGKHSGLAVILGQVSGNLACRDFDTVESYQEWMTRNSELALEIPTVRTRRGYHVYMVWPGCRIHKFKDGELRGEGAYCILPPSPHPGGCYQWIIPLHDDVPLIDPAKAGLILPGPVTEETPVTEDSEDSSESSEDMEDSQEDEVIGGECGEHGKLALELHRGAIDQIVSETLPRQVGTRDDCLFKFVQRLKSLPGFWDADPEQLRPVFQEWYGQALPNMRTKSVEENWFEFLFKWDKVKFRKGHLMDNVLENVKSCEVAGLNYETEQIRCLVKVCKILQEREGNKPFFLSTRTAGKILGIDPMTAHRWLWKLERDGWIRTAQRGNAHGQATRYRFIGGKRGDSG